MLRHEYPSAKIQGCILAPVGEYEYSAQAKAWCTRALSNCVVYGHETIKLLFRYLMALITFRWSVVFPHLARVCSVGKSTAYSCLVPTIRKLNEVKIYRRSIHTGVLIGVPNT